ncbi:hypothetical protein Hypma_014691 [Hypsizygus marmoreus]|uniref:Uncharacterized protein n=1 Tax=Hypsizygus marmoreus TaxID=39966 RepID=A0A369JDI2_HYPMA|nr:hypothetical protein Hypma_014691 [Hypsizygus marmoreus]
MATTFSWSDTFHVALSSCLPCLAHTSNNPDAATSTDSLVNNPTAHRIPRARADELQGLLADPDTDGEAERMSLHSNPGRNRKRTKRKKKSNNGGKHITLFGYDLFGHRPPPIQLPESDDEGAVGPALMTRSSSLTFDSDAAPLDPSTIDTISSSSDALRAREAALEEEQRLKTERHEKRRQRKELRRVAKALALAEQSQDFEGFQGSGDGATYPHEDYGPFVRANDDDEGDGAADLDGGLYARRNTTGAAGSGSDSKSRTSASRSQTSQGDQQFYQPHAQMQSHQQPVVPSTPRSKKTKSKSSATTRSSKTSRSNTSASTSQSPSLPSPVSPSFTGLPKFKPDPEFEGSQGLDEADFPSPGLRGDFPTQGLRGDFPSQGLGSFPSQGLRSTFPSAGLGRPPPQERVGKIERRDSILARGGAFLATRGGPEDADV